VGGLEVGSWKFEAGGLEVGSGRLEVGSLKREVWKLEAGGLFYGSLRGLIPPRYSTRMLPFQSNLFV
jgi:hypothetical protein